MAAGQRPASRPPAFPHLIADLVQEEKNAFRVEVHGRSAHRRRDDIE
jgi:hypothetical protein